MNNTPLYKSKRTAKSLWQEYRIYDDRIELQSWILIHTISIPITDVLQIEVRPRLVIADLFRGKRFVYSVFPLEIDLADSWPHVAVTRRALFKYIRFSPDDPEKFVEICKSILPGR